MGSLWISSANFYMYTSTKTDLRLICPDKMKSLTEYTILQWNVLPELTYSPVTRCQSMLQVWVIVVFSSITCCPTRGVPCVSDINQFPIHNPFTPMYVSYTALYSTVIHCYVALVFDGQENDYTRAKSNRDTNDELLIYPRSKSLAESAPFPVLSGYSYVTNFRYVISTINQFRHRSFPRFLQNSLGTYRDKCWITWLLHVLCYWRC